MPVTIRLSKLLSDRLGEQVADELVEWFNKVDATYRADLRERNDLNFARFDAKVGERLAGLRAEIDVKLADLRSELLDRIRQTESRLLRWMFAFWIGTLVPLAGLMVALNRL